jgi:pyrroloquinoline quinone biosynthesis protein B
MKIILSTAIFLCSTILYGQNVTTTSNYAPYLFILGTLQDGGSPHIGCEKDCCKDFDPNKKIVSLGIIDPKNEKRFLIEATPDITSQLKELKHQLPGKTNYTLDGIFLTHAHIGHYTGLMQLGREAMNTKSVKVFAMPKMKVYLENNGPWSQLVSLHNIEVEQIENDEWKNISSSIKIKPLLVPHRDEYSETVGFIIEGPQKKVLFIPDIDKWEKWKTDIVSLIKQVDYAFLDGTFFSNSEVAYRNVEEIPHPLVTESLKLFENLSLQDKNKVYFIHLNHTNPLLNKKSEAFQIVTKSGFHVASINMKFNL